MAADAPDHVYIDAAAVVDGSTNNIRIRILPAAATTPPSASSIGCGTGRSTASTSLSVPTDPLAKSASPGEPL